MSECPFITPRDQIIQDCCKPVIYTLLAGEEYQFWRHTTLDGDSYNVQHCQLKGRKRDVFECLNENEWRACSVYRLKTREGVTNMRQSVFREKNRMLFQCYCHALDFLDVNKIDWNDGEPYVEFSITVNPQSFWDRLRAAYRAWRGHRYVGGTDAVILEQKAVAMLVEFLQSPYEEEEEDGKEGT